MNLGVKSYIYNLNPKLYDFNAFRDIDNKTYWERADDLIYYFRVMYMYFILTWLYAYLITYVCVQFVYKFTPQYILNEHARMAIVIITLIIIYSNEYLTDTLMIRENYTIGFYILHITPLCMIAFIYYYYYYYGLYTGLPWLSPAILYIVCDYNQLTSLPSSLPSKLEYLYCSYNKLTSLPILPKTLKFLSTNSNYLTSLPELPSNLIFLECSNNNLTSLPELPSQLTYLACSNNNLTNLPKIPTTVTNLICEGNPFHKDCPYNSIIETPQEYWERLQGFYSKQRTIIRTHTYKEELMMKTWHPRRVTKWIEHFGVEFDKYI